MSKYQSQYTGKQIDEAVANQKVMAEQIEKNHQIAIRNSKQIENFKQGWSDQFETDLSVAYVKNVPENAFPYAEIKKIGGMTYKDGNTLKSAKVTEVKSVGANIYCGAEITEINQNNITYEWDKDEQVITITSSESGATELFIPLKDALDIVGGEVYSISAVKLVDTSNISYLFGVCDSRNKYNTAGGYSCLGNISTPRTYTFANDACIDMIHIFVSSGGTGSVNVRFKYMLNKGSTALPYSPYFKNTFEIPEAVQAIDGYGWGVNDEVYNYVDWEKKQFVKRVGKVDLGTLDWVAHGSVISLFEATLPKKSSTYDGSMLANAICSDYNTNIWNTVEEANKRIALLDYRVRAYNTAYTDAAIFKAAMSGVMLVYELAEPEITDISDLITLDNLIGVEGGGMLTFKNEYEYAVPSEVEYQVEV
jgi:hypothetical protein